MWVDEGKREHKLTRVGMIVLYSTGEVTIKRGWRGRRQLRMWERGREGERHRDSIPYAFGREETRKCRRFTRDIMNVIIVAVNAGGVLGIRVNNGVETALFRSGLFMVFDCYLIFYFLFFLLVMLHFPLFYDTVNLAWVPVENFIFSSIHSTHVTSNRCKAGVWMC